tara:strand:+ start:2862 stop:3233 length:372 start_codon:yes stop_codon:yes gene_type:complete
MTNPTNKQRNFETPAEILLNAEVYFAAQNDVQKPFTLPGLARALGFSRRETLYRYRTEDDYERFHDAMNKVCMRVEEWTAEKLYDKSVNVSGPIFALKNQGWADEKSNKSNVKIVIEGAAAAL